MYTFKEVEIYDVDEFAEKHGVFFQTSQWAFFKNKYGHKAFLGYDKDGNTVLSCVLFLISVIGTPFKIGYSMRGFVCDYTNKTLVSEFTEFLKAYMKKKLIVYTVIDPYYTYKTDFEVTPKGGEAHKNLLELGYTHFEKKAFSIQRPTNYRIKWDASLPIEEQEKYIFGKMEKKLQNDIHAAQKRGMEPVSFSRDEITDEVVEDFFALFRETAEQKGFSIRQHDYYRNFIKYMKKYITLYFYRYNAETDINYTKGIINEVSIALEKNIAEANDEKTTPQKRERLEPKRRELEKQLNATKERLAVSEKYKDQKYLSVYLCIKCGTRAHDFFGANAFALRELKLTSNYWDMIKGNLDGRVKSFDMGGTLRLNSENIKEDKTYDLYQYKSRYNGQLDEFLGEYYLINNKGLYNLLHNKLNYLRRILFRS